MTSNPSKADLEHLIGQRVRIRVYNGLELKAASEGTISSVGYGAFGGLFAEFVDDDKNRDESVGWNPEDRVELTVLDGNR